VAGGLGGLGLSLAALAIPGIGPLVALGTLGTTMVGAGIGAVAGGIIGGLTDLGVPEQEAHYYAEGVRRGGTLVSVRTDDDSANRAVEIMRRHGALDLHGRVSEWRKSGWTGYDQKAQSFTDEQIARERETYSASRASQSTPASAKSKTTKDTTQTSTANTGQSVAARNINQGGEVAIPVTEEELQVGKREVESGGVRIYQRVTEKPVQEQVNLREERVTVDRRPVDRPLTDADKNSAFKDSTIEVTEHSEQAVVNKQARVKEEVVVRKDVSQRTETVKDTLKSTDVQVEQVPGTGRTSGTTQVATAKAGFDDSDFRQNYKSSFANSGYTYEQFEPVYQYGSGLASKGDNIN